MNCIFAALAFAMAIFGATSVQAERRMFIIANKASGYGVDHCLASGESCGVAVAAAYCRSREYRQAASYRKVDKADITGGVPAAADGCHGNGCEYVAIECTR